MIAANPVCRSSFAGLCLALVCTGLLSAQQAEPTPRPVNDRLTFPGVVIDLKQRLVDLEATICLERGALELIACTKGTKEHESIVAVKGNPSHAHLGLLLIGAKNGKPAMRRRVGGEGVSGRWIDVPPRGDAVVVSLVFKDKVGKTVEHPISDFVMWAEEQGGEAKIKRRTKRFPSTFLFAGSHVFQGEDGKGQYVADVQGNVISISTFGDEMLCLPGTNTKDNSELAWRVNPAKMPKAGTRVTLRLRPKAARAVGENSVEQLSKRDRPE